MLIVTQKRGETMKIGDNVDITVLDMDDNQVIIGITAPRDVAVHRGEIYRKIQKESRRKKG